MQSGGDAAQEYGKERKYKMPRRNQIFELKAEGILKTMNMLAQWQMQCPAKTYFHCLDLRLKSLYLKQ